MRLEQPFISVRFLQNFGICGHIFFKTSNIESLRRPVRWLSPSQVLQTPRRTSRRQKSLLAAAWRRNLTSKSQCIMELNCFLSSSISGSYERSSVRAVTHCDCLPPDTLLQGSSNVTCRCASPDVSTCKAQPNATSFIAQRRYGR